MTLPQTIENVGGWLARNSAAAHGTSWTWTTIPARNWLRRWSLAHGMAEVLGRDIKKTPALRGRVIVTLFYEASTRTRVSFEEAGKILSADVINMSASGSSADKGESLLNTGLTLQAMGVDTLVVRHPHSGAPNFLARNLERVSVVNAGDGLHAHPTQALLDLYTVQSKLGLYRGVEGSHRRRRAA